MEKLSVANAFPLCFIDAFFNARNILPITFLGGKLHKAFSCVKVRREVLTVVKCAKIFRLITNSYTCGYAMFHVEYRVGGFIAGRARIVLAD